MSEPTTPLSDLVAPTVALPPTLEAETIPPCDVRPAAGTSGPPLAPPAYEIVRELGRGGMGVVYEARQTNLLRTVALKMILAGAHAGEAELARFRTEAESIARLQCPNIVQIHEIGEHGGLPYFALEYCAGGSLEKKLAGTPLAPRDAAALVEPLARAMQIAHDKGVIHRDLKPANVLLGEDGSPKITDFGLAKKLDEAGQTASGAVMGTPSYMAPEQAGYQPEAPARDKHKPDAQARSIGPATDVYALGAILYECLTGRPPFKAATPLDTIMLVVSVEPAAPSLLSPQVPRDLETICLKCLQKEPAKRYASARALAEDLHRFLAGEPIVARPVGRLERVWKWARRRPAAAALLAVSVLAALALIGVISIAAALIYGKNQDLIEQRDRANEEAEKARIAGEKAHDEAGKARIAEGKAQQKETEARDEAGKARIAEAKVRDEAEKVEITYLDGLLRLMGHDWFAAQNGPEKQALADLAALDDRVRLRFLERGLAEPATAERLGRRTGPILDAVAAKDEAIRSRCRVLALAMLNKEGADGRVRVGGTLFAQALGANTPQFASAGARALLEGIGRSKTGDLFGRLEYSQHLFALMRFLDADGTRDTRRTALDLIGTTSDPAARADLVGSVAELAKYMGPADASDAGTALVQAIGKETNPTTRAKLYQTVAALAKQMDPARAAKVSAAAVALLVPALRQEKDVLARSAMAQALAALADHLDAAEASKLAADAVAPLIQYIGREPNASLLFAGAIAALADHLDPAQAAKVCGDAAASLMKALKDQPNSVGRGSSFLASALIPLSRHLDAAFARDAVVSLVQAISKERDFLGVNQLFQAIAALTRRLDPAGARIAARTTIELIRDTPGNPGARDYLAGYVLGILALQLDAAGASETGRAALDLVRTEPNAGIRSAIIRAVFNLAVRMDAAGAHDTARTVLDQIHDARDASTRYQLAQVVAALGHRMEAAQAAKVCAEAATPLLPLLPREINGPDSFYLANAVAALVPQLDAPAAREAIPPLLQAIREGKFGNARAQLAKSLASLAGHLGPTEAAKVCTEAATPLLPAIRDEKSDLTRAELAFAVAALAGHMGPTQAAKICAEAAAPLPPAISAAKNDIIGAGRLKTAEAVVALARQMGPAQAAKVCADAAAPLVQAIPKERSASIRWQLTKAVAILVRPMDAAEGARAAATTADALLDSLMGCADYEVLLLAQAFGTIAEWAAPRDLADLLAEHRLPRQAAEAVLRQLDPLACRGFDSIDEAVRWFREREPVPPRP